VIAKPSLGSLKGTTVTQLNRTVINI